MRRNSVSNLINNYLVDWHHFETQLKTLGTTLSNREIMMIKPIITEFSPNGYSFNLNKFIFLADKNSEKEDIILEDDDIQECTDNCTIYGYLSKTREEKITEELPEETFINILLGHTSNDDDNVRNNIL